jgi:hypothetical protein
MTLRAALYTRRRASYISLRRLHSGQAISSIPFAMALLSKSQNECPHCDSTSLRRSRWRGVIERIERCVKFRFVVGREH